jgi:hypothetical protein
MVATPMPPEPSLSPGSPRTKAAMKVLGILPKDMESRERSKFPEGMPGDIRAQAWECKRRQLMHSVTGMAQDKSLDLTKSASAPVVGQVSEATNAFLADVMAREQVSIDKMRKRAKADVQKIVIDEMEAKKQVEIRNVKMEAARLRMVELKKKQDEKLKAQKIEAAKKLEKTIEVRRRADIKLEQEAEQLAAEIAVKDERVEGLLREREVGWEQNRVTKQAERVDNYARIARFKATDLKVRESGYEGLVQKSQAATARLADLNEEMLSHQLAKSDRTDGVIARARYTLHQAQAEKDKAYSERIEVHKAKSEVQQNIAREQAKEYAANNKKARSVFEKNYERAKQEAAVIKISPRMTKSMSMSYSTCPAWQTEGSVKACETHKTMGELRQLNLQMLARAHQHAQVQALHKIEDMRHRVKALKDSQDAAQTRRNESLRNCAIEKHHLSFQVQKLRDAPPEKMNSLLEHMGLPPIKTGKEETEEDETKK